MATPAGLLLVDKPVGPTSFDLVAQVRRKLLIKKVGHCGTLDPAASGLMLICVGAATRLVPYLTAAEKAYRGTLLLGVATNSYDAEGEVTGEDSAEAVAAVDAAAIEAAMGPLRGAITQIPPAFSAIKVKGERLYAKARRGEKVDVPPRDVVVHSLELVEARSPEFVFDARVSKGTYIRSLAVDLAAGVGLKGHLSALRRTHVGDFSVADAVSIDEVDASKLRSLADAVAHLPATEADPATAQALRNGQQQRFEGLPEGTARVLDEGGALVALIEVHVDGSSRIIRTFGAREA